MFPLKKPFFLSLPNLLGSALIGVLVCLPFTAVAGVYNDLISAAESGDAPRMAELLARGADPDTPDQHSNTLLMIAVREKSPALVKVLLDAGAKVNQRNRHGETAIMLASLQGEADIVRQLHSKGASINHKGWTPLLYAATNGHEKVVQLLLELGAAIDDTSDNGTSPLMMAVRGGHLAAAEVLLKNGANPNIENEVNGTALRWATNKEQNLIDLLKRYGARR